ncbi:hypothetical protein RvY_15667 [Ramazzottius varieornatus]|uniref:Uncharacterized protein n=1 Tax=Ramazzottius varieornatus TaxID=947166 RepID=A0A1D1VWW7_RAMVA|nr:hypothetical protein RvY_15667 [Ramazzottius varieornatus]
MERLSGQAAVKLADDDQMSNLSSTSQKHVDLGAKYTWDTRVGRQEQ